MGVIPLYTANGDQGVSSTTWCHGPFCQSPRSLTAGAACRSPHSQDRAVDQIQTIAPWELAFGEDRVDVTHVAYSAGAGRDRL